MGYKFQFVTLSAFHALNLATFTLAADYRDRGMAGYAALQEREFEAEREGYEALKHQAFVGAGYFDEITTLATSGQSSTLAMAGSTETAQFTAAPVSPSRSRTADRPARARRPGDATPVPSP